MRFLLAACFALVATAASAATYEYRMSIAGDYSAVQILAPGVYPLLVEARVTDNDLAPGFPGGLFQSSFDLLTSSPGADTNVKWTEGVGFIGAPNGKWLSTDNPAFPTQFQGTLADVKTDVIQETSSIPPGNYNAQFADVGAGVWSTIVTGTFSYLWNDLQPTLISLNSTKASLVVATLSGANVVGKNPEVLGPLPSILLLIPEPGTIGLACFGLAGLFGVRRRS
jgi:hypothetical protein